jgi:hypothetical protein
MKNNRDDFDQCAALIFDLLYKEFPRETNVVVDELAQSLDDEMADNYFATFRFLQRENFIHYQSFDFGIFGGVVLTTPGLKILDTIPKMQKQTIAEQIHLALTDDNKKAIGEVIREVIKLSV